MRPTKTVLRVDTTMYAKIQKYKASIEQQTGIRISFQAATEGLIRLGLKSALPANESPDAITTGIPAADIMYNTFHATNHAFSTYFGAKLYHTPPGQLFRWRHSHHSF